jgi:hypothetical protein
VTWTRPLTFATGSFGTSVGLKVVVDGTGDVSASFVDRTDAPSAAAVARFGPDGTPRGAQALTDIRPAEGVWPVLSLRDIAGTATGIYAAADKGLCSPHGACWTRP